MAKFTTNAALQTPAMNLRAILAFALLGLLTGCMSVGQKVDEAKVDQIKKGETTREQVVSLLGPPGHTTRNADGEVTFIYSFLRSTPSAQNFIPGVGLLAGSTNAQQQLVTVVFRPDGIVKDFTVSSSASDVGFGANAKGGPAAAK